MGTHNETKKNNKDELQKALISVFMGSPQYKKSNSLINAKGKATLTALRLFAISTKYAEYDDSAHAAVAKVPIDDIKKLLGLKGHSFSSIVDRATFKGDRNSLLDWRIIVENGAYNVVQDAITKDGYLFVTYNSKLSKQIIGFKNNYTTLNLDECLLIDSTHAFHLYEILKSRLDLLRVKNNTKGKILWKVNITDFKMRLGLVNIKDKDLQKQMRINDSDWLAIEEIIKRNGLGLYDNDYRKIKARILKKAIAEVNEKTSLIVSFEEKRVGRAVESLIFSIDDTLKTRRKSSEKKAEPIDEKEIIIDQNVSVVQAFDVEENNYNQTDIFSNYEAILTISDILKDENLPKDDICTLAQAAEFDIERIKKAYMVANKTKNITNFVGFMLSAIKGNFEPPKSKKNNIDVFTEDDGNKYFIKDGFKQRYYEEGYLESKLRKN